MYETKNAANLLFLQQKFFTMKMSAGDSIASHVHRVRELINQLASIDSIIPELDQVMTVLSSLSESYQTLVITLGSKDPHELDMEVMTAHLLQEESRQKGNAEPSDTALFPAKRPDYKQRKKEGSSVKGSSKPDWKKKIKCHICGKRFTLVMTSDWRSVVWFKLAYGNVKAIG
ncbi:hypothetical protein R1flu_001952 [Riccia fluitans]|uniref:Uncharacterized protein n=1 Tax=Riccia fluitans TaxID=41844 RepID=A0ABD1Y4R7_9MARC